MPEVLGLRVSNSRIQLSSLTHSHSTNPWLLSNTLGEHYWCLAHHSVIPSSALSFHKLYNFFFYTQTRGSTRQPDTHFHSSWLARHEPTGNVESVPKPVHPSSTHLNFGEGAEDCRGLDREDPAVSTSNRSVSWRRYQTTPHHLVSNSKRARRSLTAACSFFLVLPHGGLSRLVLQDRTFFGISLSDSFQA